MRREELGHGQAVFVVPLHPQLERLQAALQQIDIVRRIDRAHDAAELADRFELFRRADDDAGQQIVVPGQVLGGRVQHVVDAGGDRPQVVGRAQRGVDQRFDAVLRPMSANRSRSTTLRCGLVGDSLTSSLVRGVMAASIAS